MRKQIVKKIVKGTDGSIQHRTEQAEVHLIEICVRAALLVARNGLVSATRELINAFCTSSPGWDPNQLGFEQFKALPPHLHDALRPLLAEVTCLTGKINAADRAGTTKFTDNRFPDRGIVLDDVLRGPDTSGSRKAIIAGGMELDPGRRIVKKNGQHVHLTRKEFDVLYYLMLHIGVPVAHAELLQAVWGPEFSEEREYLRVIISQLRKKVENQPSSPVYLLTDAAIGYKFCAPSGRV